MGRRSRHRNQQARPATAAPNERRDRMARVQVTDDVWVDFRAAAGYRPISEVLGELVTREVDRYRSKRLRDGRLDPREIADALEHARRQQADLAAIVERLEALGPSEAAVPQARGLGSPSANADRTGSAGR